MGRSGKVKWLRGRLERGLDIGLRVTGDRLSDALNLVGVQTPWLTSSYAAIDQWLAAASSVPRGTGRKIAVYHLRNVYWVEWAAYCCCRLRILGHEPVLLYSGRSIQRHLKQRFLLDKNARGLWNRVLNNAAFEVLDLDPMLDDASEPAEEELASFRLAAQMSVSYDMGREFVLDEEKIMAQQTEIARFSSVAQRVSEELEFDRAIVPSAIVGETRGMLEGFRVAGVEVVTVESWGLVARHMIWNLNRPVVHFDYEGWFEVLPELSPRQEALMESFLAFQEDPRLAGTGPWSSYRVYQPASVEDPLPEDLEVFLASGRPTALLGTNVVGDTATLGREIGFESQLDWLEQTLAWFKNHPDHGLVIRVHPGELFGGCAMPLAPWLRERVAGQANVHLVGPQERVNTYAIGRRVVGGLLYVSNLGSDLVARGLPVITVGKTPYYGLGIAQEALSADHYIELLERLFSGRLEVSASSRKNALRQIYVFTRLTSMEARPTDGRAVYDSIQVSGADPLERYYKVLSGDLTREDQVAHDRQEMSRLA